MLLVCFVLGRRSQNLSPQVIEEPKNSLAKEDIMVVVGGVIPVQDHQFLMQ